MVDQKVLFSVFFIDAKKVLSLSQDLDELNIFSQGKLAGNTSFLRALRPMNDDLLGSRHVGRQQNGCIHLFLPHIRRSFRPGDPCGQPCLHLPGSKEACVDRGGSHHADDGLLPEVAIFLDDVSLAAVAPVARTEDACWTRCKSIRRYS